MHLYRIVAAQREALTLAGAQGGGRGDQPKKITSLANRKRCGQKAFPLYSNSTLQDLHAIAAVSKKETIMRI